MADSTAPGGSFAAERAEFIHVSCAAGIVWGRVPARARHQAGLDQFQAVEEPGDLPRAAQPVRRRGHLVPLPDRLDHPFIADLAGGVGDREVAAATAVYLKLAGLSVLVVHLVARVTLDTGARDSNLVL
jgi:hypothetical protein